MVKEIKTVVAGERGSSGLTGKRAMGVPSGMMEDALYLDRGLGFLNVGSLQNSTNGTLKICATYSM